MYSRDGAVGRLSVVPCSWQATTRVPAERLPPTTPTPSADPATSHTKPPRAVVSLAWCSGVHLPHRCVQKCPRRGTTPRAPPARSHGTATSAAPPTGCCTTTVSTGDCFCPCLPFPSIARPRPAEGFLDPPRPPVRPCAWTGWRSGGHHVSSAVRTCTSRPRAVWAPVWAPVSSCPLAAARRSSRCNAYGE